MAFVYIAVGVVIFTNGSDGTRVNQIRDMGSKEPMSSLNCVKIVHNQARYSGACL